MSEIEERMRRKWIGKKPSGRKATEYYITQMMGETPVTQNDVAEMFGIHWKTVFHGLMRILEDPILNEHWFGEKDFIEERRKIWGSKYYKWGDR